MHRKPHRPVGRRTGGHICSLAARGGGWLWPTPGPVNLRADNYAAGTGGARRRVLLLGAYETPIDKMLSLPTQRAILELVPDEGAEPRPDGPQGALRRHVISTSAGQAVVGGG